MVKPLVGLIFIVAFLIVKPTMVDFLKHYFGFEPKFKSELYAGVTLGAYCKEKGLANGFYMINPFENLDKQFEIFCYNKRDFIILPINNTYNNYIFTDKCTGNKCYDDYDFSANKRANFHAIEINANTMQVVANNSSIESVNGGGNNFSIMPNGFSNINLIGTPFAIDWDNSSVSGCVIQKRGHFDQAVKIKANPTQGESVCNITKMKLKLLNEYKFSHDNGTEIVANSCRRLADKLPKTMVASKELQDYRFRWIAPISQTRSEKTYDKTKASERPFVASCLVFDVQGDSSSEKFDAWTVLLALDGKTTANKNDLNQKLDSCSSFGLYPFVANSETTFERARWYLSSIKPNWESYVVNMNERIESVDGKGKGYYLPSEGSAKLWPYGSFGVYFPKAGDKDINGVSKKWGSGVSTTVGFATVGWVAGSPMHNIEDITNDYPTYVYGGKNIYVGSPYSLSDTKSIAKTYTYADTLGAKGFRSILADLQSNSDDVEPMSEWFISRTGAGRNTLHPTNYYEPNGNYVANCWFNYLFDNDGRVRHMDDYNCGYKYNDYLCMASNNYTSIEIKKLQDGVFDAVNSDISLVGVPSVANRVIKTQVVNEPFALKLYISDVSKTSFISDATKDITAGVYLFNTATNTEVMKLGEFSSKNGTMSLTDIKVPRAVANAQVKFKYCADYTKKWSECWSSADVGKVTAKGGVSNGSTDLFAIRPDRFELTVDKAQKTGDSFYIIARAYDANKGTKTDVINFIKNYNLLLFAQPAECNLGTLTPQDVNFNAVVPYKGVYTYSEAGDVKFLLQESSGNEFAIVDAKDTPQDRRFITPSEVVVNFTPYQFQLKSSLKMNNGTFVYFSNDIPLDFGVSEGGHYSFELIAEGKPKGDEKYGTVVKNYRPNCMQTMKKVTIKFDSIMPSENLTKLNFALSQTNSTADSDKTDLQDSSSGSVELGIDHLTFATNYQDGDAIQRLSINFDRDSAHPINPLLFKPTQIILEDGKFVCVDCDNIPSAKFLYGRVYTPDIKTLENPYDKAQINYEVYCTLANCGDFFANSGTGGAQGWLVNEEQTTNLVKNITSLADTTAFKIDTKGYRVDSGKISNVSISSSVVPRAEVLRVDVPKYLVYDKYNKEMTNFYFIVEFYANSGASNWGGEGSVQKDKHNNVGNHIQTYPVRGSTRVRD